MKLLMLILAFLAIPLGLAACDTAPGGPPYFPPTNSSTKTPTAKALSGGENPFKEDRQPDGNISLSCRDPNLDIVSVPVSFPQPIKAAGGVTLTGYKGLTCAKKSSAQAVADIIEIAMKTALTQVNILPGNSVNTIRPILSRAVAIEIGKLPPEQQSTYANGAASLPFIQLQGKQTK